MKNFDIELSEKVAEKASEQITELKSSLNTNKDAHISLLSDVIGDVKENIKTLKHIISLLFIVIVVLIIGATCTGIYSQYQIKNLEEKNINQFIDFMNNCDFESTTEIVTDNNSDNSGSISVTK